MRSGELLDARYRLHAVIARGGMSEVWSATDERDQRSVVVKALPRELLAARGAVARFEREGAILRRVRSPFVCCVVDAGSAGGQPFLVFERLVGETLAERLKQRRALTIGEAARILDDVLEGLIAAHDVGVVHRDLKPSNVFLEEERAKLLDFGISKLLFDPADALTTHRAAIGTVAYMAPEQCVASSEVDARADLYALGAVAFRVLTGRLPFNGSAEIILALKQHHDAPRLAEVTGSAWPPGLEAFVARVLARAPDDRFVDAREAQRSLRALDLDRTPDEAPRDPLPEAPANPAVEATATMTRRR